MIKKHLYYIDYYRNEIPCGNIGCLRITEQGDCALLSARISGLPHTSNTECLVTIILKDNSSENLTFPIQSGCGSLEKKYPFSTLQQVNEYRFDFGQSRYGIVRIKQSIPAATSSLQAADNWDIASRIPNTTNTNSPNTESDITPVVPGTENMNSTETESDITPVVPGTGNMNSSNTESDISPIAQGTEHMNSTNTESDITPVVPGTGNMNSTETGNPLVERWRYFKSTFPVVHPFEEQDDFVMIDPDSIRMLSKEDHRLMHNSFLLHSYYNYRHILLGPYTEKGNTLFYICVPGSFHKREQMVADMFGFEGYEHSGESGYYLRRVNLLPIPTI